MTIHTAFSDKLFFNAVLRPNRSLSPRGFKYLMVFLGAVSFMIGMGFFLNGAWPVFGFFGLDVLAVYIAFRSNYRTGQLYETVELGESQLRIRRVHPDGAAGDWVFEPYWVRLQVDRDQEVTTDLWLTSHGRRLHIGAFLSPDERGILADSLGSALERWKRRWQPASA